MYAHNETICAWYCAVSQAQLVNCEGIRTESHDFFLSYKAEVPYLTFYTVQSMLLSIFIVVEAL